MPMSSISTPLDMPLFSVAKDVGYELQSGASRKLPTPFERNYR
jgi:hypothetical protein